MFRKFASATAVRAIAASTVAMGIALAAAPAHADTFDNDGFETGDATGWTLTGGYWHSTDPSTGLPSWPPPVTDYNGPATQWEIQNAGNFDPNTGAAVVFAGQHSMRLNDLNNDYSITAMSQSVNNYLGNKLYYSWNAVLEPSHGATDSPSFIIKVTDKTTGTTINYISYSAYTAQQTTIFRQAGNYVTSDWKVEDIDMVNGHDYEMIFIALDCPYGGHRGYVYVDTFGNAIPTPNADVDFDPNTDITRGSDVLIPIGGTHDIDPSVPFYTITDLINQVVNPNFVGGKIQFDQDEFVMPLSFTVLSQGGSFDLNGRRGTFSGGLTGTGSIYVSGLGVLNVTVAPWIIDSGITVDGSTLLINSSLITSNVNVINGGVLGGRGSIAADIHIGAGSRLAPGNSPGTLVVVGGDVTLDDAATFDVDVDGRNYTVAGGAGSYDRVVLMTGATFTPNGILAPTLRGITGDATNTFTPTVGDTFAIVTGGTINAGAFDSVTQPATGLAANTRFDVLYRPTSVALAVTPINMAAWGADNGWSGNAIRAAGGLSVLRPTAGARSGAGYNLYDGLYGLTSDGYGAAFSQLSGEIHADALQAARDSARSFGGIVLNQAMRPWGCTPEQQSMGPFSGETAPSGEECGVTTSSKGATVWGQFIGLRNSADADGQSNGYRQTGRGLIAGASVINTNGTRLGFGGGFTDGKINDRNGGSADFDTVSGFIYGSKAFGPLSIGARAGYDKASVDTTRTVNLTTGGQTNKSSYHVETWGAALEAQYNLEVGKRTVLRPVAGIEWARSSADGLTETGSATTGLAFGKDKWTSARTKLGAELAVGVGNPVEAQVFGNWKHELKDPTAVRVASLGAAQWAVSSVDVDKDGFEAGGRLSIKASNAIRFDFQYSLERNGGIDSSQGLAGVAVKF
ncbi:autotransporter family protein [Novosphingobium colocasiae]|nr:autotransporter outer membrane beta-barrel domain-containing protein [Novosphingobium colocasiae]